MRHFLRSIVHHHLLSTYTVMGLFVALLLIAGLLVAQPAAAQISSVLIIGYGQTIPSEVTSPNGTEHLFTGCVGEVVGLSVTANDFSPRVELYAADDDTSLESAAAATEERSVALEEVPLPASGLYTILVSGRSRGDRGGYSVTLQGTTPDDLLIEDGNSTLDLVYEGVVSGSVQADNNEQWIFRGCAGDEIHAQLDADNFTPQLELLSPIAEFPIATAIPEAGGDGVTAVVRRSLPNTGVYTLIVGGASGTDAGDYRLRLSLEGTAAPVTPSPGTPTGGPRVRRGIPTPKTTTTPTQAPAQTPSATPEFIIPSLGENVFRVLDISSEYGPVNRVAYSPDGTIFATAGEDGAVRAWDAFSGELLQTLTGHETRVNDVAFAPNDKWLASAGDDGTVRLWNQAGQEVATLAMPDNEVTSVAFSPSSAELVATTDAGDVSVWSIADERVRLALEGHQGPVYAATFSPDGTLIATGDGSGVVRIWDAFDGELDKALPVNAGPGSSDPILSVAFSRSTDVIVGSVIGVNAASIQVWNISTGKKITEFEGHREWGSTAVLSPDEAYIFSAGRAEPGHDGPVTAEARIWNAETGALAVAFVGYPSSVITAAFRPDGDELLTSDGTSVYIWPVQLLSVFAATYAEPIGIQIPVPTVTPTPTASDTTATRTPNPIPTTTVTRSPTPTLIPTATVTPTPVTPSVSLEIFCTVITDRLNLRPGPGTNFNPPLTVIETGAILVVIGRNQDSSWLQVALLDDTFEPEIIGWVSAGFVFCVGEIEDAPVVEVE